MPLQRLFPKTAFCVGDKEELGKPRAVQTASLHVQNSVFRHPLILNHVYSP